MAAETVLQLPNNLQVLISNPISFTEICRLCLKTSKCSLMELEEPRIELLRQMGRLELKMDIHPKKVCSLCLDNIKQMEEVQNFLNQCRTSEDTLKKLWGTFSNLTIKSIIPFPVSPTGVDIMNQNNKKPNTGVHHKPSKEFHSVEDRINVQDQPKIMQNERFQTDIVEISDTESVEQTSTNSTITEEFITIDDGAIDDATVNWIDNEIEIESNNEMDSLDSDDVISIFLKNGVNLKLSTSNSTKKPPTKRVKQKSMCENCGMLTSNLVRHKINNKECCHKCDQCDFTTIDRKLLKTHLIRHKKENKVTQYKKCHACGVEVESLLRHRHENKSCWFKCEECDTLCKSRVKLREHKECVHGESKYVCEICSAVYKFRTSLRRHLRLHKYGLEFTCEVCGKQLTTKIGLDQHLNIHQNGTPFRCPVCDQEFISYSTRYSHIKSFHPEHKLKKTGTHLYKNPPMRLAQKSRIGQTKRNRMKPKERSPFKCKQCPYETKYKAGLTAHERVHTGEKPFSCQLCGKTFRQQPHLNSHIRVHRNIKNHACGICGKKFIFKNNMLEHEFRHKQFRPFPCHVCSRGFYTSSSRKKHVLTEHGQDEVENIKKHTWKIQPDDSTS